MQNQTHLTDSGADLSAFRNTEVQGFDPSPKAIGARLALVRVEAGLTQAEFARRLGVSLRSYHFYEKGDRSLSHASIVTLGDEFGADLNWLFLGPEVVPHSSEAEALEEFEVSLDQYLSDNRVDLIPEKRRAITAAWYQGRRRKWPYVQDKVTFWIEMLR